MGIDAVATAMRHRLADTPAHRRPFADVYLRTTVAVGAAVAAGRFEDPAWVECWDADFAGRYFAAHDADVNRRAPVPRPWRLAFDASAGQSVLRQLLLGMNAHINYDLPASLVAVISAEEFARPDLLAARRRDHERIDGVLGERVHAEDARFAGARSVLDRLLTPINRRAARRFLAESRRRVWHNAVQLNRARGEGRYAQRLAELEVIAAAKVADLLEPGQVLLKLAAGGFGVVLPPPAWARSA